MRTFNHSQPTVASTHGDPTQEAPSRQAGGQLAQQPETQEGTAGRAQGAPSGLAEGDLGPPPKTFTPWEALQIVQAELATQGPVFAEPLEQVLADLGQKPEADGRAAARSHRELMEGLPRFEVRGQGQPVRYQSWERLLALGELKLEVIDGQLTLTAEQLRALCGLLLETVGTAAVLELTGPRSWRQALDELDNRQPSASSASAPCRRPGWTAFEKLTHEGVLTLSTQVRHALGLPTGGWLAFFAGGDGQIQVLAKDKYRARFGPGIDDF